MKAMACVIGLLALVCAPACVAIAPVVQGKVVAVELGGGLLRVQDEEAVDRPPLALDITGAEIGGTPRLGDVVRIVYRAGASSNQALRVMNLSRRQEKQ